MMNKHNMLHRWGRIGLLEVVATFVIVSVTLAASSPNYRLDWAQMGAGGGEGNASPNFRMDATIAQGVSGNGGSPNFRASIGYRQPLGPANGPTSTPASPTATFCPIPFVDITGNVFFYAIRYLYCRGVINGVSQTAYGPGGTSTRGQFAKVVVLGFSLSLYTPAGGGRTFTDVAPNYFAYTYIETGYHNGVLGGFDATTCSNAGVQYPCYLPNRPITRAQLTKLVVNAGHISPFTPATQTFVDVGPNNIFYATIETAHYHGIVGGYSDGTFRPNNNIRRDEMAQIVYKGIISPPLADCRLQIADCRL